MKRILVPIGCRSDEGLSAPVIKRLREHFTVDVIRLHPQKFLESYAATEVYFQIQGNPDLILITGDRVEMCAAAAAAFHNKVKIAHFYAGIINDPITTFDDVDRHCITLWSDIQFCESDEAKQTLYGEDETYDCTVYFGLFHAICKEANTHIVGISHLDDLEVDESKVPHWVLTTENPNFPGIPATGIRPYDLYLINAEPLSHNAVEWYSSDDPLVIQIGGNPDDDSVKIIGADKFYPNLPRPQFLGLLKNCRRFITNSSSAIYEAPHFLKPDQIIMVGNRNRNRTPCPLNTGASDRIVKILQEYLK